MEASWSSYLHRMYIATNYAQLTIKVTVSIHLFSVQLPSMNPLPRTLWSCQGLLHSTRYIVSSTCHPCLRHYLVLAQKRVRARCYFFPVKVQPQWSPCGGCCGGPLPLCSSSTTSKRGRHFSLQVHNGHERIQRERSHPCVSCTHEWMHNIFTVYMIEFLSYTAVLYP